MFAFSYLPLLQNSKIAIDNLVHRLQIFKYEYHLPHPSAYMREVTNLTALPKDFVHISSKLCSTVKTPNIHLFNLLEWKNVKATSSFIPTSSNTMALGLILAKFLQLSQQEVLCFLPTLLPSVFTMLNVTTTSPTSNSIFAGPLDKEIFASLIHILKVIYANPNHEPVWTEFVQDRVVSLAPRAWWNLTKVLLSIIDSGIDELMSGNEALELFSCIKVFKGIFQCGVSCWSKAKNGVNFC